MIYLIVQKWYNTKSNHSGMYHLGRLIVNKYPKTYHLISIPDLKIQKSAFLFKFYNILLANIIWQFYYMVISVFLLFKFKKNDKIILFEYLTPGIRQDYISMILNFFTRGKCEIYGLLHIVPTIMINQFSHKLIKKKLKLLTGVLTFGSSLTNFLRTYTEKPILTLHHYSDLEFYKPSTRFSLYGRINVLVIGQQGRNYTQLYQLVKNVSYADFHIITTDISVTKNLGYLKNVKLYHNITESELIKIMEICHCSLGFYDNVVGSNVLSNCVSMGIICIVTDVGSIRDYLSEEDAFLCKSIDDFEDVLGAIDQNRIILVEKRQALLKKSHLLNYELFHQAFIK